MDSATPVVPLTFQAIVMSWPGALYGASVVPTTGHIGFWVTLKYTMCGLFAFGCGEEVRVEVGVGLGWLVWPASCPTPALALCCVDTPPAVPLPLAACRPQLTSARPASAT